MATKTVPGWGIINVLTTPKGEAQIWENESGEQIQLIKGMIPDEKTLDMLAISGIEPMVPGDGDPEFEIDPDNVSQDPNEIALSKVLGALTNSDAESGGRVEIRVSRFLDNGKEAYCTKFSAEEFEENDLELIRQSYGSGRYRIKVMATSPKVDAQGSPLKYGGRMVIRANQIVEIVQPIKPLASDIKNNPTAGDPMIAEIVRGMQAQNAAILEKLSATKDPMASMKEMFGMMTMMRSAMGLDQQRETGVEKLITQMTALDKFKSQMKGENADDSGGGNNLMNMAVKVLDVVKEAQSNKSAPAAPQAALPYVAVPASIASAQPNPVAEPEISEEDEVQYFEKLMMNARLKVLCKHAEKDEPVEKFAEEIAGDLPDDVIEVMTRDEWFAILSDDSMFPIVKPFEAWFTKLRDEMIRLLKEDGYLDEAGKIVKEEPEGGS